MPPGDPAPTIDPRRNAPEVEALYAAAPDRVRAEILHGVVMMSPRPRTRHSLAASRLGMLLGARFDLGAPGPGGWVILHEPELHLGPGPDKMGPDLAGWRRARMPALPDAAEITLAPDWVCEVLSPSTEVVDRGAKMPIYAREGVAHVWLVDPEQRALEVFRHDAGALRPLATYRADARVRAEPFDALELDLTALWL